MAKATAHKTKPKKALHSQPVELRKALAMPKAKRAGRKAGTVKSRMGNW